MVILIHALNLIVVLCCCCLSTIYGSKGNPDPSRLKKMRDLIRKEMSIRTDREYNINKRHINVVKPKVELLDKDVQRGVDNSDDSDRIELFVRRIDNGLSSGPWNYVQYLPLLSSSSISSGNGYAGSIGRDSDSARSGYSSDYDSNNYNNDRSIKDLVSSLSQGGIESESVRPRIDNWVALKVFGKGLGSPVVLEQVKVILPQFKKLNMRNLQFGYKVSKIDTYVSSIERHMHQIGSSVGMMTTTDDYDEHINSASKRFVNLTELLSNVNYNSNRAMVEQYLMNSTHSLLAMDQLMSSIDQLVHQLIATNTTDVLLASDGSSIFNGNNCSYATGGIFVIPICDRQQVVLGIDSTLGLGASIAYNTVDTQMESSSIVVDNDNIVNDVVGKSKSKNKKSFQLPTINNANTCNVVFSGSVTDRRPLYLRMTDMAGIVTTPFDAELGSAVISFLVANLILKRYKMMITTTTTAAAAAVDVDIDIGTTIVEARSPQLSFQFLTDSRAFIRTLRTDLRQDLMQKNMTNRLALWSHAVLSYDQLLSSDDAAEVTVDWTMGHPERRDLNINTWSIKDKAIWIADELAKNNNRHQRYQSSAVSDGNPEVTAKDQSQDSDSRSDDDNNITHHHHHQTETLVLDRLKSVDGLDVGEGGSNILEMNMVDCLLLTKHYLLGKEGRHQ